MTVVQRGGLGSLVLGDVLVFIASLWLALLLRNLELPSFNYFIIHLVPFSLLFVAWLLVFFIAGLYDRHVLLVKSKLPQRVFTAHIFNLALATGFFYLVPFYALTPKLVLALYLVVSFFLLGVWRFWLYPSLSRQTAVNILILGSGPDISYLKNRVDQSAGELLVIKKILQPEELNAQNEETILHFIQSEIQEHRISMIAIDLLNPAIQKHLPALYSLIFDGVRFINVQDLYENMTDKVPLSLINETWFLRHASIEPNIVYDSIKRIMDVCITLPLFIVPIITYPILWVIMKLTDRGPFYYSAERIGQGGKRIKINKVRSMTVMDDGNQLGQHENKITKLGKIIRVTRLDEFAQLWSVLKGDMSLIGPRPEFPKLVDLYSKEIPHYNVRHLIKPGLSGWAQIHHEKPPHTVEETVEKLAYDLYYIKNRSILLDLKIALQTIKTLLSRVGI